MIEAVILQWPKGGIVMDTLLLHSKKKSTSEHLFWCSRLSQIEDSIQYLEGPNSTWKDHYRNLGIQMDQSIYPSGPQDSHHGPSRYYLVLPGTEYSPLFVTT